MIKQKRSIAVDVDLSKFFDRVNHDLMMTKLSIYVKDKQLLALIGRYLRAGIIDKGNLQPSTEDVPQGGPLSPLLSNILLDSLDKELEHCGHHFARYADDFIILKIKTCWRTCACQYLPISQNPFKVSRQY